jgi:hypothetical protein
MPYIPREKRIKLEPELGSLISKLKQLPTNEIDGNINFIFTKILDSCYDLRYFSLNRAMGSLESVKQEFYRRKIAPYEDSKMNEHGDVFTE